MDSKDTTKASTLASLLNPAALPIYSRQYSTTYDFYLSGPITDAEDYTEWFDTIRNTGPDDFVYIRINSRGGYLSTAIQFSRVMAEAAATIVCSIEGDCMSAATMIFLAGDRFEITPHSSFMLHNYSGGSEGKGGEMYDQIVFEREWSTKFLHNVYEGFLSKKEINILLDGKDIWLHYEDVATRVQAREAAKLAKQAKQQKSI